MIVVHLDRNRGVSKTMLALTQIGQCSAASGLTACPTVDVPQARDRIEIGAIAGVLGDPLPQPSADHGGAR